MGGYLAGRLRVKWTAIHSDEVYFRDTAHGFLVWAVALVLTAAFLGSSAVSMAGGMTQIGGPKAAASTAVMPNGAGNLGPDAYFVDSLFRSEHFDTDRNDSSARVEAGRIFAHALTEKDIPATDKAYLARLVAARTGLSEADADKRVSDTMTEARQAADAVKKAAAHILLWIFLALLIGAFCASYAATIGGRQRDHVKSI
jgi:hypothetical protein